MGPRPFSGDATKERVLNLLNLESPRNANEKITKTNDPCSLKLVGFVG